MKNDKGSESVDFIMQLKSLLQCYITYKRYYMRKIFKSSYKNTVAVLNG